MAGKPIEHQGRHHRPRAMNRAMAALRQVGQSALGILYPPQCLACGVSTATPHGLCGACWRALPLITRPYCERLGLPFARDAGPGLLSAAAIARPPAFARARAVARFEDGPSQRLVHRLKYGDRPEIARLLGPMMARAAGDLVAESPVLVPMPLHRRRLWQRQFNQSALLADEMARVTGLRRDAGLLLRIKPTVQQVGLSRAARARNVQGAFAVAPGASAEGRDILLVDDVMTTGSTANAAAHALLRAGARRVDLIVFALVADEEAITI